MENIRVVIWGFGAMGRGMADMLLDKDGADVVGACDIHPDRVGRDMHDLLGRERGRDPRVVVSENIDAVLRSGGADIALLATDSFTEAAFPKIEKLMNAGLNVISTAEEMSYPAAQHPDLAERIDRLARKAGVTVLGAGINPGLIMDLLVLVLTGACRDVRHIEARRVNSLSPFGPAVMEEQGVGLGPEEFERRVSDGSLAGHVGFPESVRMIADGLGWILDGPVEQTRRAIVSSVERSTPYARVEAGRVAGCDQRGRGFVGGEERIRMIHPQQIEPEAEGISTGDFITIDGNPKVAMAITPEIPGGTGTVAMCVNMIPQVMNAAPGLKTMLDLPVPRAILGDMRDRIEGRDR